MLEVGRDPVVLDNAGHYRVKAQTEIGVAQARAMGEAVEVRPDDAHVATRGFSCRARDGRTV